MSAAASEPCAPGIRATSDDERIVNGPMGTRPASEVGAPVPAAPLAVDRAWRAADNAVELVRSLFDAQAVALFTLDEERLILRASHGLTQDTLDAVADVWRRARTSLSARLPRQTAEPPALVLPCADAQGLAGLAYIEGRGVSRPAGLALLVPFSQVLARVLRGRIEAPPEVDEGPADPEAATLYVLMERNEWNVARVARLMGVTRMTIYNRLRRARLPRKRVAKAPRRKAVSAVSPPA